MESVPGLDDIDGLFSYLLKWLVIDRTLLGRNVAVVLCHRSSV